MTIRQQIESQQIFTETEKCVVELIHDDPQSVSEMSIHTLAQAAYTSTPTVLRVCKKLGYDGFKAFKKALLLEIENEKHLDASIDASQPFRKYETPNRMVGALNTLYKESVGATASMLDLPVLSKMAGDIYSASRVFLYAIGDTKITCQLFANKLLKLNIYPIFATGNYQEKQETHNLRTDDYALFVSYKGLSKSFASCASELKRRGVKTGLITGNADSPLVSLSGSVILLPNTEEASNIATFHSQISIGFALNALYSLIYQKDYESHSRHKNLLDSTPR